MSNGEMEFRFRKEDQEVLAALDQINAKLELVSKTAVAGHKKAKDSQKEFTDQTKKTEESVGLVGMGLEKLGAIAATAFSVSRIVEFGRVLDEIYQKIGRNASAAAGQENVAAFSMRYTPAEQSQINQGVLGMRSPLEYKERMQAMSAIYQQAPGISPKDLLSMTQRIVDDAAVASGGKEQFNNGLLPFTMLAGKLRNAGMGEEESLDLAKTLNEQGIGQDGEKVVRFGRRYSARAKTPEERERLMQEGMALAGTAIRSGETSEFLEASLERLNQVRRRTEVERVDLPPGMKGPDGKTFTERKVPVFPRLANDPRSTEELFKEALLTPISEAEQIAIFGEKSGAGRNTRLGGSEIDKDLTEAFAAKDGLLRRRANEAQYRTEENRLKMATEFNVSRREALNLGAKEALPILVQESIVTEAEAAAAKEGQSAWRQETVGWRARKNLQARRLASDETFQNVTEAIPLGPGGLAIQTFAPETENPMQPLYDASPGLRDRDVRRNEERYRQPLGEEYDRQMREAGDSQMQGAAMQGGREGYIRRNSPRSPDELGTGGAGGGGAAAQRQPPQEVNVRISVDAPEGAGISAQAVP